MGKGTEREKDREKEKKREKEQIRDWLRDLRESGKTIIVEGRKDKEALESLGVNRIMTLKKPLYAVAEDVSEKASECVILTDFDSKGREIYGRLKKHLERDGIRVDRHFREFLQKNTRVSHIEGLDTYYRNSV
ncbi:MAG: toprim domain-containing protein [Candidatus Woesearchaeota archaeon]